MKKLSSLISQLSTRKGFTLIELLIVIVIIGVLATILLANFIGVRQRSRDAQRKADLRQIQSAVELYKADQTVYPAGSLYTTNCPASSPLTGGSPAITYMTKLPCDPSSISIVFRPSGNYYYALNGTTYQLVACIENSNDTDPNVIPLGGIFRCPSTKTYYLTNP